MERVSRILWRNKKRDDGGGGVKNIKYCVTSFMDDPRAILKIVFWAYLDWNWLWRFFGRQIAAEEGSSASCEPDRKWTPLVSRLKSSHHFIWNILFDRNMTDNVVRQTCLIVVIGYVWNLCNYTKKFNSFLYVFHANLWSCYK